jgi:hypothetical protein
MSRNRLPMIAAILLLVIAAIFAAYSYVTSESIDRSAVMSGSSTDARAPNTLQDRGGNIAPQQKSTQPDIPPAR